MSRITSAYWAEFFSDLVSTHGHTTLTRPEIKQIAEDSGLPGGSAYTYARKNFAKHAQGVFDITSTISEKPKSRKKAKSTAKRPSTPAPAPAANVMAAAVAQVVDIADARVLRRHSLQQEHEIQIPAKNPTYVANGANKILRKIFKSQRFAPFFITGDTGNGKTMGVEQAAAAEGRKLVMFNITNETCAEDLIGSETLIDGNLVWEDGPVLRAMREGAVLLLDELDQGTHKILCLQTILQGKPYFVKKTGETVYPTHGFTVVATGNTKGLGDPTGRFGGAQLLNEAFLERFNGMITQEYPTKPVETKILGFHLEGEKEFIDKLTTWAQASRQAFDQGMTESKITTRRLVQIAENFMIFGSRIQSIAFAVERFNDSERDQLLDMYSKLDADVSLDELFQSPEDASAPSIADMLSAT